MDTDSGSFVLPVFPSLKTKNLFEDRGTVPRVPQPSLTGLHRPYPRDPYTCPVLRPSPTTSSPPPDAPPQGSPPRWIAHPVPVVRPTPGPRLARQP